MIKKPALILVICALILAGVVYYLQKRSAKERSVTKDTTKPAFTSVQPDEITSVTISHPAPGGAPAITIDKKDGAWQIVQPVETEADDPTVSGFVDELAEARVDQTESGAPDRRKAYGLNPPQQSITFELKSGAKHTIDVGNKDFSGTDVYTVIDGGQSVSLLPAVLSTDAAKSLDDMRDRAVLHIDTSDVSSFTLQNPSGELSAARDKQNNWKFTKPAGIAADNDSVSQLLSGVANAKMAGVVDERADNLGRYGLAKPALTFTAVNGQGGKFTLEVGKKDGAGYDARDVSRPTIFRIDSDLYTKLSDKLTDLRDKRVVRLDPSGIEKMQVHNASGEIDLTRKKDDADQWTIDAPAAQKGKTAETWKVLDPFTNLHADEIIDHPAAAQLAPLRQPAVTAVLTDKDGKQLTVRISKAAGDFVYAQSSDGPAVYKLKKAALDTVDFKPADLAAGPSS